MTRFQRGAVLVAALALSFLAGAGALKGLQAIRRRSLAVAGSRRPPDLMARIRRGMEKYPSHPTLPAATVLSLPYLSGWHDDRSSLRGVGNRDSGRMSPGLTFYSESAGRHEALLVDEAGREVWRWNMRDVARSFGLPWFEFATECTQLFPDGELLVVVQEYGAAVIDRNSKVLLAFRARAHHNGMRAFDGTYAILIRRPASAQRLGLTGDALLDDVGIFSSEGRLTERVSILDAFVGTPYEYLLPDMHASRDAVPSRLFEVFHANQVLVFDGTLADRWPLYRRGNILVGIRNLNTVAILDADSHKVVWAWGPSNVLLPHDERVLSNGNILIFSNGLRRSEVVEMDPRTGIVVWRGSPSKEFYSSVRGGCQRLPNGNTLVTESERGYGYELTPDGTVVWEFANPDINEQSFRQGIFRMVRFDRRDLPFLGSAAGKASVAPR